MLHTGCQCAGGSEHPPPTPRMSCPRPPAHGWPSHGNHNGLSIQPMAPKMHQVPVAPEEWHGSPQGWVSALNTPWNLEFWRDPRQHDHLSDGHERLLRKASGGSACFPSRCYGAYLDTRETEQDLLASALPSFKWAQRFLLTQNERKYSREWRLAQ